MVWNDFFTLSLPSSLPSLLFSLFSLYLEQTSCQREDITPSGKKRSPHTTVMYNTRKPLTYIPKTVCRLSLLFLKSAWRRWGNCLRMKDHWVILRKVMSTDAGCWGREKDTSPPLIQRNLRKKTHCLPSSSSCSRSSKSFLSRISSILSLAQNLVMRVKGYFFLSLFLSPDEGILVSFLLIPFFSSCHRLLPCATQLLYSITNYMFFYFLSYSCFSSSSFRRRFSFENWSKFLPHDLSSLLSCCSSHKIKEADQRFFSCSSSSTQTEGTS